MYRSRRAWAGGSTHGDGDGDVVALVVVVVVSDGVTVSLGDGDAVTEVDTVSLGDADVVTDVVPEVVAVNVGVALSEAGRHLSETVVAIITHFNN